MNYLFNNALLTGIYRDRPTSFSRRWDRASNSLPRLLTIKESETNRANSTTKLSNLESDFNN